MSDKEDEVVAMDHDGDAGSDVDEVGDDEYDESSDGYAYDDMDDSQFDGFLNENNVLVHDDLVEEEIMNYLRLAMDPKQLTAMVANLIGMVGNTGSPQKMAQCICEFVIQCSPSNVEFCQRMNVVNELLKQWKAEAAVPLANALNDVLDPEKTMNTIPGRNITYFIRCLTEEGFLNVDLLNIKHGHNTSCLSEKDASRLKQVLYHQYSVNSGSSWGAAISNFLPPKA